MIEGFQIMIFVFIKSAFSQCKFKTNLNFKEYIRS